MNQLVTGEVKGDTIKRLGNLYAQIVDYDNLWHAYQHAAKGKRFRDEVLIFSNNLEANLINIQNELIYHTYQVGHYREFYVFEPKKRLIMALPFKDRVVQWAIYRILMPLIDKRFIEQSCGCREGKGVQLAADILQNWSRKISRTSERPYYLKLDISKYFYRIDHEVLFSILKRMIKDPDTLRLLHTIIFSETKKFGIPVGVGMDDIENRVGWMGMPIGNLTSQLFANLYLNELDQYAKHELHMHYYVRYMDDVIILDEDKRDLHRVLEELDVFISSVLHLQLNNKTCIRPISTGIDFCGFRIWPTHRKLRKKSVRKMKKRLKYLKNAYARGEADFDEIGQTVNSYLGYMKHADCHRLMGKVLNDFRLTRNEEQGP